MRHLFVAITLILLSSISFNLYAAPPDFIWAKKAGANLADYGYAIASDAAGNSYVTGSFQGTATFGAIELTSFGSADCFVAKLDPDGNWLWVKQAGGTGGDYGYGIAVSDAGTSYVTGSFGLTANFGATALTSAGDSDLFVAKLDTDGTWLWADRYGFGSGDRGFKIGLDSFGNCYVAGHYNWSGEDVVLVGKWNSAGTQQWTATASGTDEARGHGIAVDDDGTCYVTGYISGRIDFGSSAIRLTSSGVDDIFVAKLNSGGTWLWARRAGSTIRDRGESISLGGDGYCYVAGYFNNSAEFGSTTLVSEGSSDIFVAKLDTSGTWQWAVGGGSTSTELCQGICADNSGNCYVTGLFNLSTTFGTTSLTSKGAIDIYIARLDNSGTWAWAIKAGGSSDDGGNAIAIDSGGMLHATGYFRALNASFGSTTLASSGSEDIYVTRLEASHAYPVGVPVPLMLEGEQVLIEVIGGLGLDNTLPGILPPFNNEGMDYVSLWLSGSGLHSFTIVTLRPWGAVYVNGHWLSFQADPDTQTILFANIDFGAAKGDVPILLGDEDPTLPVTLSSFTAIASGYQSVKLNWITQTETGVLGYKIFRNSSPDLASALLISPLIPASNSSNQAFYTYEDTETPGLGTYHYWLQSADLGSHVWFHGPISITLTQDEEPGPSPEVSTLLHRVYPNPFNPSLFIPFSLADRQSVTIRIFNLRGQIVKSMLLGDQEPGFHQIAWDGKADSGQDCPAGVYHIELRAGLKSFSVKAVLLK